MSSNPYFLQTFYENIYNSIHKIDNNKADKNETYNLEMPLERRKLLVDQLKSKYPNKIPIVVNKTNTNSNMTPNITKNKFIVSGDMTVGQFIYEMRKHVTISNHPEIAIFLFVGKKNIIPNSNVMMNVIYDKFKNDDDGMLMIYYSGESTFGK
jgi:GABA(A) receptor-associated protein